MTDLERILHHQLVCILRGADTAKVMQIVQMLYDGGIRLVEITMNSPNPLASIEKLSEAFSGKMLIGAGTVLNTAMAKDAIAAGAKFIISPTVNSETIRCTKAQDVVSIPGAYTPTEILTAFEAGGDIIKVFPARGNVDYLKDIQAPLPHIPLMPTGGITPENIVSFKKAGAVAFGIGSSIVDMKTEMDETFSNNIIQKAQAFVKALV
jgi:2-dehydro-3-deoxyphosphogluconate aldolase/(4S)-4-hydroxy-2-oxoglutarate aldolase